MAIKIQIPDLDVAASKVSQVVYASIVTAACGSSMWHHYFDFKNDLHQFVLSPDDNGTASVSGR